MSGIAPISGIAHVPAVSTGAARTPGQFQDVLANAIQQVEQLGKTATASVGRFLGGEGEELHTAVLATQRAEMAFDLFLQTRNKVVQAYQEIMRLQM